MNPNFLSGRASNESAARTELEDAKQTAADEVIDKEKRPEIPPASPEDFDAGGVVLADVNEWLPSMEADFKKFFGKTGADDPGGLGQHSFGTARVLARLGAEAAKALARHGKLA